MKNICFYFQLHQPYGLKRYRFFEIGNDHYYYDDFQTEENIRSLAEKTYIPANQTLLECIHHSNKQFKCAFSISGSTLEQLEQYAPEVIDSFRELADTGCVEFLVEPYAHSLASIYNDVEFERQVNLQAKKIEELFGYKPTALRNSALIYSDEIGEKAWKMGYKTMLIEGGRHVLGWKSPHYVYHHAEQKNLNILIRDYKLSDDISFRFSDKSWTDYPLTADKYMQWIASFPEEEQIINIWLGYEAFGSLQDASTGIFDFLKALPYQAMVNGIEFTTPSQAVHKLAAQEAVHIPNPIAWASEEKDLSIWTGNALQQEALSKLYAVTERVRLCKQNALKRDWLHIQSSDYFRYMSYKSTYDSPYESPYEAFVNYMNILSDFLLRVEAEYPSSIDNEELNALLKTITEQENELSDLHKQIHVLQTKKK
ncbi:MAG: alpha-amylase [Paludibacteraceae bacterium]|nr:alpha-amylase [Paludibacteraceae bacterium]MBP6284768.1 alpha-amylase [Paludibacteraceae bacterium]